MTLILFDVDGTLTQSFKLDTAIYVDALHKAFGFEHVSSDWSKYRHVTDAGILEEVCENKWGRKPNTEEIVHFQGYYLRQLAEGLNAAGGLKETSGASEILRGIAASRSQCASAYATGGWQRAAICKLQATGLPTFVPAAFSDDAISREEICTLARRRAEQWYGEIFEHVVSVGDGVWDARTAARLGYGFVGIAPKADAANLREAGVVEILPNFGDAAAFFAAVEREIIRMSASSRSVGTTASAH